MSAVYRSEGRRLLTALAVALALHAGAALLMELGSAGSGGGRPAEGGDPSAIAVRLLSRRQGAETPSGSLSRTNEEEAPAGGAESGPAGEDWTAAGGSRSSGERKKEPAASGSGGVAESAPSSKPSGSEPAGAAEAKEANNEPTTGGGDGPQGNSSERSGAERVRRDFYPAGGAASASGFSSAPAAAAGSYAPQPAAALEGGQAEGAPVVSLARAVRARVAERKVYPQAARRRGMEGRVVFSLRIDGRGRLQSLEMVESPETGILSRAAERLVRSVFPLEAEGRFDTRSCRIAVSYRLE